MLYEERNPTVEYKGICCCIYRCSCDCIYLFHISDIANNKCEEFPQPEETVTNNKIHIVSVIDGEKGLNNIEVLIKSIMYHQKRFRCQYTRCCLADLCKRLMDGKFQCPDVKALKFNGLITFHFLIDKYMRAKFQKIEKTWQLKNVKYQFYEYERYLVIILDVNLLFNADIHDLWNHFRYFTGPQMIGITTEQNPYFETVMSSLVKSWKGYGYNTGVALLDLTKLRSIPWNNLWMSATKFIMKNMGYLTNAEQDVINLIASRSNEIFYEISCDWNIQLSSGVETRRCPVSWRLENKLANNEDIANRKQPKIVHMNHQIKPEDIDMENITNMDTNTSDVIYSANLLYKIYLKEYFKYRLVSRNCFH
ncbi:unnamed protein product [Heterobilharzia americana]|nr:unnamed protein product [Heterobilharzia americana]